MRSFRLLPIVLLLCVVSPAWCAPQHRRSIPATADVLMLSDIHFDPFYDPANIPDLRREPVTQWPSILSRPDSPNRLAVFTQLQSGCGVRGSDSPWALVAASLREAKLQQRSPLFVTVSGDLLAHGFLCKFNKLNPTATPAETSAFAAKTMDFLAQQLRAAFPSTPVYMALGNNDSGCADYGETPGSPFLQATAKSLAAMAINPEFAASIAKTFPHLGDYSAVLPAPFRKARLIVLQDIYQSARYKECKGQADPAPGMQQIAWLREQLSQAREAGQQVWIMAHVPPGVDVYTTFHRYIFAPGEACSVQQPQMFLSSDTLTRTITEFSDIVRVAIFAHTHMDEIKLLQGPEGHEVAAKLVPSISPINGNDPSFMIAQVDPQTATMKDYEIYAATNAQGTTWNREYRYSGAYHLPDFSAASVDQLSQKLVSDKTGEGEVSRVYERYFLAGGGTFAALGLQRLWPAYSCSLRETDSADFHRCMCPGATAH